MVKIKNNSIKEIFDNENILKATYNVDLIEYLKKYDGKKGYIFTGVIMRDEVIKMPVYDKQFFIVNYDKSTQEGSHWVAVVKNKNDVYHFGSYGIPPLGVIKSKFSKNKIYYSDTPMQLNESSICGYLCLKFIEWMIQERQTFYEFLSKCMSHSSRYKLDVG